MPLDPELELAVEAAAQELGQPSKVTKRLLSWLREASEKELSKEDEASRLADLFSALVLRDTGSDQ